MKIINHIEEQAQNHSYDGREGHVEGLKKQIDEYDQEMEQYLKEIGREQEGNWSKYTSNVYQYVYYPKVYPVIKDQGFKNDK